MAISSKLVKQHSGFCLSNHTLRQLIQVCSHVLQLLDTLLGKIGKKQFSIDTTRPHVLQSGSLPGTHGSWNLDTAQACRDKSVGGSERFQQK